MGVIQQIFVRKYLWTYSNSLTMISLIIECVCSVNAENYLASSPVIEHESQFHTAYIAYA